MKTGEKMRDVFIRKELLRKYLSYKIFDTKSECRRQAFIEILEWVNQ